MRNHPLAIRRALLSVSDKSGLIPFATFLNEKGIDLVSTGGTSSALREAGIPVRDVSDITGFPEMMDGRVKTLHPRIHAGILERRSHQGDQSSLSEHSIPPIDLVVVNLYPFKQANRDGDLPIEKAIEFIDIGGPSMLRGAAKNLHSKAVACDPSQYEAIMKELSLHGDLSLETREALASAAFDHTADYDAAISAYFQRRKASQAGAGDVGSLAAGGTSVAVAAGASGAAGSTSAATGVSGAEGSTSAATGTEADAGQSLPSSLVLDLPRTQTLRYGENPHQNAAVYGGQSRYIDCFHGKELSYNNYLDLDAALRLLADFGGADSAGGAQHVVAAEPMTAPTSVALSAPISAPTSAPMAAIFKHTVPCGVATAATLSEAWSLAYASDRTSPFGGILAFNRPVDIETATLIDEIFSEIVVAPDFHSDALSLLQQKKNRRLVRLLQNPDDTLQMTSIFGGMLVQQRDSADVSEADWRCVTSRVPNEQEWKALRFAWTIVRHVKSNAIVFTDDRRTLGIGNGQTSRVDSSEIAIRKAAKEGLSLKGSVVASDAFFPFADGVEEAASAGATAVIQPGGSVRDEEVIEAANRLGLAMVFTARRHFRH